MATQQHEYTVEPFDYSLATKRKLVAMVDGSDHIYGTGVLKVVSSNSLVLTVDGEDYVFNHLGNPVSDNACTAGYKLKMGISDLTAIDSGTVGTTKVSMTRSVSTDGDITYESSSTLDKSYPITIDDLNARDKFALQVLDGILNKIPNPDELSKDEITHYCEAAYTWAGYMMKLSSEVRAVIQDANASSSVQSAEVGYLESNTEKLLNNIVAALEKTDTTITVDSQQVKAERVSLPELKSLIEAYVRHTPEAGEPATKTTVGLDDLIKAIKSINTGGGGSSYATGTWSDIQTGSDTAAKVWTAATLNNLIDEATVADGSITTAKLATSSVTANKIAPNTITSAEIAENAITESELSDSAVTTNKIDTGAVTTTKIADNSITAAKMTRLTGNLEFNGGNINFFHDATSTTSDASLGTMRIGSNYRLTASSPAGFQLLRYKSAREGYAQDFFASASGVEIGGDGGAYIMLNGKTLADSNNVVTASGYKITNKTDADVVLAGGGTIALSEISGGGGSTVYPTGTWAQIQAGTDNTAKVWTAAVLNNLIDEASGGGDYLPLSGGILTGNLTLQSEEEGVTPGITVDAGAVIGIGSSQIRHEHDDTESTDMLHINGLGMKDSSDSGISLDLTVLPSSSGQIPTEETLMRITPVGVSIGDINTDKKLFLNGVDLNMKVSHSGSIAQMPRFKDLPISTKGYMYYNTDIDKMLVLDGIKTYTVTDLETRTDKTMYEWRWKTMEGRTAAISRHYKAPSSYTSDSGLVVFAWAQFNNQLLRVYRGGTYDNYKGNNPIRINLGLGSHLNSYKLFAPDECHIPFSICDYYSSTGKYMVSHFKLVSIESETSSESGTDSQGEYFQDYQVTTYTLEDVTDEAYHIIIEIVNEEDSF